MRESIVTALRQTDRRKGRNFPLADNVGWLTNVLKVEWINGTQNVREVM